MIRGPRSKLFLFFLATTVLIVISSQAQGMDSVGVEEKGDKVYIIHEVESKETWYSISRRYKVDVEHLQEVNSEEAEGLKVGQQIRIPYNQSLSPKRGMTHSVKPGETLYSISKTYEVDVEDLQKWNNLEDNFIQLGQVLVIKPADGEKSPEKLAVVVISEEKPLEQAADQEVKTVPKVADTSDQVQTIFVKQRDIGKQRIVREADGYKKITENGLAMVIEDSKESRKFLALHRSAPVGTILQVRNEMNNQRVFVRVIGRLPDTGINDKILIKISMAAYTKLGGVNQRFPVIVNYSL